MDPGPPPGPGWTLGDDGHWKPPPFDMAGPTRPVHPAVPPASGPSAAAPPPGVPPWPPPGAGGGAPQRRPPSSGGSGRTTGIVVASVFGAFALIAVVCIAAVTMVGQTSSDDLDAAGSPPTYDTTPTTEAARETTTTTEADEPDAPGIPKITEAVLASQRVSEYVGGREWRLAGGQELPLTSTELCSPSGWNTGADSRFQTVYDHLTDGQRDGEMTINLTVYDTAEHATDDKERAGSEEWYACQRRRIDNVSGDDNPSIQAAPSDGYDSNETYIETYRENGEPVIETFHYVFVGQVRATITYCGCTEVGLEGRQAVGRDVATALAEVQALPAPGKSN